MQRKKTSILTTTLMLLTLGACATDARLHSNDDPETVSQIGSAAELNAYLETVSSSPLDSLEAGAKQRFIDSLVFTQFGLASYSYVELQGLEASEIYQILKLFNAAQTTTMLTDAPVLDVSGDAISVPKPSPRDNYSYKCDAGNCVSAVNYICLSTCQPP